MIQQMLFYTMFFSAASTDLRPEAWEITLFPDKADCQEMMKINRECMQYLENKQANYAPSDPRRDGIRQALNESLWSYQVWDALDSAWAWSDSPNPVNHLWYISSRREYLNKVKNLLGDEWYHQYKLPPPIPFWRLQEIEW